MQQLRSTRLERAFADLEDPTLRHQTIGQIAFRNGFVNVSHFSDAFKAQFGRSPRDVRTRNRG